MSDDYTETLMKRRLADLMSDISEECYCAGWMCDNEYTLWAMVTDHSESRRYGMTDVPEEDIAELKLLSERLGGWVVWWDDGYEPTAPTSEWGTRFLTMAEWTPWWDRWVARMARLYPPAVSQAVDAAVKPETRE